MLDPSVSSDLAWMAIGKLKLIIKFAIYLQQSKVLSNLVIQ